jgi:hypothetical protein
MKTIAAVGSPLTKQENRANGALVSLAVVKAVNARFIQGWMLVEVRDDLRVRLVENRRFAMDRRVMGACAVPL